MKYADYDRLIKNLIPRYEEMHSVAIDQFNFPPQNELSFLDLGIGTGQTALVLLNKFPKARVHGVDISPNMLMQAKERLRQMEDRIIFSEENMTVFKPRERYDGCIGILSIHHLNENQKRNLFGKVFTSMKSGGIFSIGDIITFDNKIDAAIKEKEWKKFLIKNLGDKEGDYWFQNYLEEDLPSSVASQLKWLNDIGFRAECVWEYMNYAVISAEKP